MCKCMNKETANSINYIAALSVGGIYDFWFFASFTRLRFFNFEGNEGKIIDFAYLFVHELIKLLKLVFVEIYLANSCGKRFLYSVLQTVVYEANFITDSDY